MSLQTVQIHSGKPILQVPKCLLDGCVYLHNRSINFFVFFNEWMFSEHQGLAIAVYVSQIIHGLKQRTSLRLQMCEPHFLPGCPFWSPFPISPFSSLLPRHFPPRSHPPVVHQQQWSSEIQAAAAGMAPIQLFGSGAAPAAELLLNSWVKQGPHRLCTWETLLVLPKKR